jgi:hypothetical protein
MPTKTHLIAVGAIVGVVLSAAFVALSFATQSLWAIFPGAYVVASVGGIQEGSVVWSGGSVFTNLFCIAATDLSWVVPMGARP